MLKNSVMNKKLCVKNYLLNKYINKSYSYINKSYSLPLNVNILNNLKLKC